MRRKWLCLRKMPIREKVRFVLCSVAQNATKHHCTFNYDFVILLYCICFIFIYTLVIPCGKFEPPYLGKATAAERAVLPSAMSTCWVFSCFRNPSNSDLEYIIFNVHTITCPWTPLGGCHSS